MQKKTIKKEFINIMDGLSSRQLATTIKSKKKCNKSHKNNVKYAIIFSFIWTFLNDYTYLLCCLVE